MIGMTPLTTPMNSGRFLQSRIGSAGRVSYATIHRTLVLISLFICKSTTELPPLFSAPLGLKDTPTLDTGEKARPINFAHSFDILDMPSIVVRKLL